MLPGDPGLELLFAPQPPRNLLGFAPILELADANAKHARSPIFEAFISRSVVWTPVIVEAQPSAECDVPRAVLAIRTTRRVPWSANSKNFAPF